MIEMPMAQYKRFDISKVETSILQDISHVLFDSKARNMVGEKVNDARDRVLPVHSCSQIKQKLLACLVMGDNETVVGQIEIFVAFDRWLNLYRPALGSVMPLQPRWQS